MTTLQTSSTRNSISADLSIQRAQISLDPAESAPSFGSVLDAFSESQPDLEAIDNSEVSEESQPEEQADESGEERHTDQIESKSSDQNAADSDEPSNTGAQSEEPLSQIPITSNHQNVSAEQVQSAADLGLLLTNAARINLADLAKQQLEGYSHTKPASQPKNKIQSTPASVPQQSTDVQESNPLPNQQATKHTNGSISAVKLSVLPQDGRLGQGLASPGPQSELANHQASSHQHVNTHSNPQLVQVTQVVATDLGRAAIQHKSNSPQPTVGINTARSVTTSDSSNQANTSQSGFDLGGRSQQAENLSQSKSVTDRPLMRREVMAQVQRGLASIMNTKGGTMRMRLNPDHLGDIKIELSTKDGQVRVKIDAANEDARLILKDGLEGLKHSMESRGVRIDDIRVNESQQSAFDQMFNDTDRDSANSQQDTQQQGAHREDSSAPMIPETDLDDNSPQSIWTELGLDAIA